MMRSRLGNFRLYKFDAPDEPDSRLIIINLPGGGHTTERFKLSQLTRPGKGSKGGLPQSLVDLIVGSKGGLPKALVDLVDCSFMASTFTVTNQILEYIVSNFSFKDFEIVPPTCPVLVFHFQPRNFSEDHVPEIDITPLVLSALRKKKRKRKRSYVPRVDDGTRPVPIAPPATEIVDCYQSSDLCRLCGEGYPKEDEIVHKTKCNHIFHGTCISHYLLHTPHCPVCSAHLSRGDIQTLLFS